MMSVSDLHSKEYENRYRDIPQFDYNKSLSSSCPNIVRKGEIGGSDRDAPRSMRTFRSRLDQGEGEARAVESRVFSGPIAVETHRASREGKKKTSNSGGFASQGSSGSAIPIPSRLSSCLNSSGDFSLGASSCSLAEEVHSLDFSLAFSDLSSCSSDISGELQRLASTKTTASTSSPPPAFPSPPKESVTQAKWVGRFVKSREVQDEGECSSRSRPSTEFAKLSSSGEVENLDANFNFRGLIEDLESTSIKLQRTAAARLRLFAKNSMENRIIIANSGAIKPLVSLLFSVDPITQENAVTALLNLSLYENNKSEITAAGAIKPLIHVLKCGTSTAKENAACTLLSLSLIEDNKATIGTAGAIPPLVALLINGSLRGKKDAATTLYTLSSLRENKDRAIRAGAIRPLVDLMADPSTGMVDKAAVVLGNLATLPEGKSVIVEEGGIPVLVEVVEVGSQRGKEYATSTLLQLCENSYLNRTLVLREGAIPPLVALSQSGTTRAKQKATTLLQYLREPRQGSLQK
ncbi:hypothetical protein SUGI_0612130 [Cryptomeria japonica]|uniref:U-box domain-containing protein 4 isoform X2 n=1 Tax=Cryptomeria japonica TaxID=3369 RepID=UPI002414A1B7|nr:U-box domain-containing protein 4 isoform X2 [Cryptomeria japonica]GLJ30826.1 hypothetical protein SUGI_0612130 [Cryptomeria japonica]